MNFERLDLVRKRGRPAPKEHPNRVVKPLGTNRVEVRDEPDAAPYEVTFLTAAMRDAFLSRLGRQCS